MKLQSSLALAACLSSAAAQGMAGLPTCAQSCATGAIPKECNLIDVECICGASSFVQDMACCVGKTCDERDQQAALAFANGICGGAGITDLPQSATCTGNSTSTSTASESSTTTPTESASNDNEATTTTSSPTPSETATSTADSESTSSEVATETASETPASPQNTGGAALLRGREVGLLAGIAAGVAFLM